MGFHMPGDPLRKWKSLTADGAGEPFAPVYSICLRFSEITRPTNRRTEIGILGMLLGIWGPCQLAADKGTKVRFQTYPHCRAHSVSWGEPGFRRRGWNDLAKAQQTRASIER